MNKIIIIIIIIIIKGKTAKLLGLSWGAAHLKNMQTNFSGVVGLENFRFKMLEIT